MTQEEKEQRIITDAPFNFTLGKKTYKIKAPTLGTLDRVSREALALQWDTQQAEADLIAYFISSMRGNAWRCATLVAIAILGERYTAWRCFWLRRELYKSLTPEQFSAFYVEWLGLCGLANFTNTIRLIKGNTTTRPHRIVKEGAD